MKNRILKILAAGAIITTAIIAVVGIAMGVLALAVNYPWVGIPVLLLLFIAYLGWMAEDIFFERGGK